jgi:predicted acylesterase/phospholipase RssA
MVSPKDIKYLALEGGGGKGFAYLGALQMLEKNPDKTNILQNIQGVAGTSAGAITALLISLGMSAAEIENEMNQPSGLKDFNDFFDPTHPRLIPKPLISPKDSYDERQDNPFEKAYLNYLRPFSSDKLLNWAREIQSWASQTQSLPPSLAPTFGAGWLLNIGTVGLLQWLNYAATGEEQLASRLSKAAPPLSNILTDLGYLTYLIRDMGLFCGLAARTYFDNLIANRCAKIFRARGQPADPSQFKNLPFMGHHKIFGTNERTGKPGAGKDLLVCGANFSTGKTQPFSYRKEHTPYFPVADAIRISMSLPLVYKPYVITETIEKGWPPCGTYVDGGVWNNLPFREVDPVRQVKNTLALRLEIDQPRRVEDIYDIFGVMLQGAISTGESHVLNEFKYLSIVLDTRDLSLLKFQPDDQTKSKVTKRSRRAVCEYFNWPIDKADLKDKADLDDEAETKRLRAISACASLGY